jgi:hypothetical protein
MPFKVSFISTGSALAFDHSIVWMLISHGMGNLRLASYVAHLARAASGETITDTCPNLNMGSTALSNSIPISSTHTMSNSEPESGLQTDATWKSNLDPTFAVLGTNSTPTPITTSNSVSTATPTLIHNPRSGPGLKPGLASRPAHQAPIVSLPGTSAFVSSSTGAKSSFDPPASRLLVRSDVAAEIGDTGMGMDAEMDGQREVDQGQGRDPEEVRRQRQDELRLQEEDQVQRQDGRQREDEVEHQREDRIQSEVTSTRTSGKVAGRGAEQKERELRSQPQSQKECEQIRVDGIQGREGEMVAEQHRLAPSPSAITIAGTPLDSGPTSTVTVIERTQTQMGMNSSGTGQEVPGTTRLDPMHREATQLDPASVSPRRLLLSNQRLPARLSPTYLDPLPNRSPIFATAGTVSASAPAAQIAVERNEPVVVRSCVREAKLKEQYKAVGPLDLEMATSPPGIALATVSSNAETSVEAVSPRPEHNETSTARDSSLHPSTPNHYEPQNSRGGGKDNVEKHQKVTRTTLYLDEGESLIYRVGQRGISNE